MVVGGGVVGGGEVVGGAVVSGGAVVVCGFDTGLAAQPRPKDIMEANKIATTAVLVLKTVSLLWWIIVKGLEDRAHPLLKHLCPPMLSLPPSIP